ncbi:MAG: energy transducer TonB [Opitutales bacterium]
MIFTFLRRCIALLLAFVVTIGLFVLMEFMISRGNALTGDREDYSGVDFVRLKRDDRIQVKEREIPQEPPPPKKPPPPPKLEVTAAEQPKQQLPDIRLPNLNLPSVDGAGAAMGGYTVGADASGNRGLTEKFRVDPMTPRQALLDGINGWVELEITVDESGSVLEAKVTDYSDRMFVRPVMRVIYKWQFHPKMVNGEPVPQTDRYRINFTVN